MQGMILTVLSLEDFGSVRVLRMGSDTPLPDFQAGHYATLQFGSHAPRPYSIATPPHAGYLEFHIKNAHHQGGSSVATTSLAVGDHVTLHGFGGNYSYQPECNLPLLLIAGGTGLAPLLAIARASLAHRPEHPIRLYYGGRHHSDLYFDAVLKNMAAQYSSLTYIPTLSEENVGTIPTGYVGDIALNSITSPHRIYVAGPVDMLRSTLDKALQSGHSPALIHSNLDSFT